MSLPPKFNIYSFGLEHENIEVVRWMPEAPAGKPILVVPGWGETMQSFSYFLEALTEFNRPIYGIMHLRDHLPKGSFKQQRILQEYKADNIIEVIELLDIKKTDVIGHSEAAVNISIAASKRPDLFSQIILVAPVSINPIPSYWYAVFVIAKKLSLDAWAALRNPWRRKIYAMHFLEGLRYHFLHPIRSTLELISIAKSDIRYELEKISKSVKLTAVIMDKDIPWPPDQIKKSLADIDIDIEVLSGWHDELHFQPEMFIDVVRRRLGEKTSRAKRPKR